MSLEEEYMEKLKDYVSAYVVFTEMLMHAEELDGQMGTDPDMEKLMEQNIDSLKESESSLIEFKEEVFGQEAPELPNMTVYFDKNQKYHDLARRIFSATLEAGNYPDEGKWKLFELSYVGDLLYHYYQSAK